MKIISQAVKVLRAGGLLIYPTETVYGLGADATNQKAVDKLLKFKGQRGLKPILIAVSDQKMAEKYVQLNDTARRLYQTFLPGPVAVISRIKRSDPAERGRTLRSLAQGIASPEETVGVRIPDYPLVLKIIKAFGKPITSTSANISGAKNPWSIQDILETTPKQKLEMIDLIIGAGQLPRRPPSTVIDTSHEETEIVRQGEIKIGKKAKIYISDSPEKTMEIAQKIIQKIPPSLVLALQGPLGAGKTVFAKGIAAALGVTAPIRSPSYTLVHEYPIPHPHSSAHNPQSTTHNYLYHLDAWRLSQPKEFADLGLEKMLRPGNVIVIEWIDRLAPILDELKQKAKIILVKIEIVDDKKRNIKIEIF
jgi:L-threonylcarbamoyladenylate synthase